MKFILLKDLSNERRYVVVKHIEQFIDLNKDDEINKGTRLLFSNQANNFDTNLHINEVLRLIDKVESND